MNAPINHPKVGDQGEVVIIHTPTQSTPAVDWIDPDKSIIWTPGSMVPPMINFMALERWSNPPKGIDEWNTCNLRMPSIDEPPMPLSDRPHASGVVIVERDWRIWLVSPTNQFGGYKTTFPKGKVDPGLSLQANAIKEGFEESGLKVRITGYLGDFKRTSSMTRLYLAERVGGDPSDMGWESQAVTLAPPVMWDKHLQHPADKPVVAALRVLFNKSR